MRIVSKEADATPQLLLLGAEGALEIYDRISGTYGVEVLHIRADEQNLIDEAVVASIGGDPIEVERCRQRLRRELISPREEQHGQLTVVEACTDFSFGLGVSSLELFAEDLVRSCYG